MSVSLLTCWFLLSFSNSKNSLWKYRIRDVSYGSLCYALPLYLMSKVLIKAETEVSGSGAWERPVWMRREMSICLMGCGDRIGGLWTPPTQSYVVSGEGKNTLAWRFQRSLFPYDKFTLRYLSKMRLVLCYAVLLRNIWKQQECQGLLVTTL